MTELAVVERYIYGILRGLALTYGWETQIAPFDVPANDANNPMPIGLPVLYFRLVATDDRNAIGPGPRLLSTADYEIGVFHRGTSFGANLPKTGGTVALLTVLGQIDDAFQNYTPPITVPDGTVYSSERAGAVRIPERGPDGLIYKRDGGIYRFHVEAA